MTTKLFERLVSKFSIKVSDLVKYLEVSKATIYNYRNLDNFSDIPKDKQYKIFYLFGKESVAELELVLDEADNDVLAKYVNRISGILKGSAHDNAGALASVEELSATVERLKQENGALQRQLAGLQKLSGMDEFTRTLLLEKISSIINGLTNAEIKEFFDYLEIFAKYKMFTSEGK